MLTATNTTRSSWRCSLKITSGFGRIHTHIGIVIFNIIFWTLVKCQHRIQTRIFINIFNYHSATFNAKSLNPSGRKRINAHKSCISAVTGYITLYVRMRSVQHRICVDVNANNSCSIGITECLTVNG